MNSQIPQVLLTEENLDMGSGIEGEFTMSRNGQISWTALDSQRIQLTVPVKIAGEVGLKKRGLGNLFQSRLPLDEEFSPVFIVNPSINSDWKVTVDNFELLDLGGSLELDILGMQVDLSGLLSKEISKWGEKNLTNGKSIADLKTLVDLAWAQVGKPFEVAWLGGTTAFSIQPTEVRFHNFFDQNENLTVWLGLQGKIITHPVDAAPSRAFPLPKLSPNDQSENHLDLIMPLAVSYAQLDQILSNNVAGKLIKVDKKTTLTPSNIKTRAYGDLLAINMDFDAVQTNGKSLQGTLFVVTRPSYDAATQSLIFTDVNFKMESGNLGAQTSVGLKKGKIIRQIESKAVFPIGNVLQGSLEGITDRLRLSTPIADLKIADLEVAPDGFYPTSTGLIIQMKAAGEVDVEWK
ncbi:DUF4403 family protein [Algoriphagus chordae]|nr:DUF4403 family protein [Algoriphagus chordae]